MKLLSQYLSFFTIFITGFASSVGQILFLRELLILFYGNELSTGLILTAWLFWTAVGSGTGGKSRFRQFFPPSLFMLAILLIIYSLLLPLTLLWIRASRILWNIAPGEILPMSKMVGISFSVTCPFCIISGFLFSMTWESYTNLTHVTGETEQRINNTDPTYIYLGESAGAALGGIIFYFILLPYFPVLTSALITSAIIMMIGALLLSHEREKKISGFLCWSLTSALIILMLFFYAPLDYFSRKWQWGEHLITVIDTPFHNLAIVKDKNLFTFFSNGLWIFSSPDPESAEKLVHPALLQHPDPQIILLIGGGVADPLNEILKHPQVKQVDYIEPDPEIIRLAEIYLPSSELDPLYSKRVRLFHEDAAAFIRQKDQVYDVILMNVGDPVNAQMNRFYTKEFYQEIKKHLKNSEEAAGIFSFSVSSALICLDPLRFSFSNPFIKPFYMFFRRLLFIRERMQDFLQLENRGI